MLLLRGPAVGMERCEPERVDGYVPAAFVRWTCAGLVFTHVREVAERAATLASESGA
jgi:hypothetical protein